MNFLLVTEKKWHLSLFRSLKEDSGHTWHLINSLEEFTQRKIEEINPDIIFIPHWSHIIPKEIYGNFECIVFHMTDLPYGRGGSPLQNLIARGHETTKISALKVNKGIDTGDIYLKRELILLGTAEEIFIRASKIIFDMIFEIIIKDIKPVVQEGHITNFKRRKPQEGNLLELNDLEEIFNYIRMLDAEGYPNAYLEFGNFRLEFSRATLKSNNSILADVRITKK